MNSIAYRVWLRLIALALLLACSGVQAQGTPEPADALNGALLTAALQKGGFVIYFRHADTGPPYSESGVDLNRCDTQRNLNDAGREDARQIGEQFRRLRIPVGSVLSSEFCRCIDTAQLAFGRYEKAQELTGAGRSPEFADRRKHKSQQLRRMLATPPPPGQNTVLVSHGFNLLDAEGFHLGTQGEAAIYRTEGGGYRLVARVLPDQWAQLPLP